MVRREAYVAGFLLSDDRAKFEHRMNSTELLDHFWKQVTKKVVPRIQGNGKRTVGVWMADRCVVFASA